jgi:hypothetical protein
MAPTYGIGLNSNAAHDGGKNQSQATHPLLSCADVQSLLAYFLPRRHATVDDVIAQFNERHQKRQADIDRYLPK